MAPQNKIEFLDIAGKIFHYNVLPSTQAIAKRLLASDEIPPFSIIADSQSNGIGRFERNWFSPPGGIYLSWVTKVRNIVAAPLALGIALCGTISKFTDEKIEMKWPNDILLDRRKLAGILVEKVDDYIIAGMGINTFDSVSISESMKHRIATIPLSSERKWELLAAFYKKIEIIWERYQTNGFGAFLEEYLSLSLPIGTRFSVKQGENIFVGEFAGITSNGEFILKSGGKIKTFSAGETSIDME